MVDDLFDMIEGSMSELRTDIEKIPITERVHLLFIQQRYEETVTDLAKFCSEPPHESELSVETLRAGLDKMMHKFNEIAAEVSPLIAEIRRTAGKIGTELLSKILSSTGNVMNYCIAKLIKVTEELGKNIGIQGYSIGVGIGGYLTFAINYAPVSIK